MFQTVRFVRAYPVNPQRLTVNNGSSSIYKVIRPVLNFLFFFTIRFHKYKKAQSIYWFFSR